MKRLLHICWLPVAHLLRLQAQQGSACVDHCSGEGLSCSCLALNRGLHVCEPEGFLTPPAYALAYERQGLQCEARLPEGAKPMAAPPLKAVEQVVDPREEPGLESWAKEVGGFYTQYFLVHQTEPLLGVPILAGPDVSKAYVMGVAQTLEHLLLRVGKQETLAQLSHLGVRFIIAGRERKGEDPWLKHPEVDRHFVTGLGGGAPWFPSSGVYEGEKQVTVLEEMLHTIQYCALSPRMVCMYHKAYQHAMLKQLYTTDGSAEEVDGEPVPTVQADEYLAMAMHRWFGSGDGEEEYKVPGNTPNSTGRSQLQRLDPKAFCLLSQLFRADDLWDVEGVEGNGANEAMKLEEVKNFCESVLKDLAEGCPSEKLSWPVRPRLIP